MIFTMLIADPSLFRPPTAFTKALTSLRYVDVAAESKHDATASHL